MEKGISKTMVAVRKRLAGLTAWRPQPQVANGGRGLATRVGAVMLLAGAVLIAVTVALPPAARGSDLLILALGAVTAAVGAVLLRRRSVSERALGFVAALGTAVITISTLQAGAASGAEDNQVLYLWVCFYAFWFFGARHALFQLALIGVGDAVLLIDDAPSLAAGVTQWLVTVTTFLIIGLLIGWVRRALEREREETAQLAVLAERMRIARELHDSAGHSVTAISLQATAGLGSVESDPGATRQSLEEIKQISKGALADMRRLLGILRPDDPTVDARERVSVGRLEELVRESSGAGVATRLEIVGPPEPLPAPVDQAAYRIVEEALANVRKHAGGDASCTIRLTYSPQEFELEVRDNGPGTAPGPEPAGSGLIAMRERTELFGGRFEAGPADSGGFRIRSRIPLTERLIRSEFSA